ncbi:MAG: PaaI family thioesterase [Opitutales bacterium]
MGSLPAFNVAPATPTPLMSESWKIKLLRWRFNWYPAYRRSGARITRIAEDLMEIDIRLPLNRATSNLHGTIYGGAIYAAVDPLHAVMVATHLGPDYHIWMKSARIEFRRPGRTDLHARVRLHAHELEEIRAALITAHKVDREFSVSLVDTKGEPAAHVYLTVHIRRRQHHEAPMQSIAFPP